MNRTELRMGTPVTLDDISLIPIERVAMMSTDTVGGLWFHATKAPVALAVCGEGQPFVLNLDGSDLSLTELCRQLPELEVCLRSQKCHG